MLHRIVIEGDDAPLVFDTLLDGQAKRIAPYPMGGWWGKPRSNEMWPLVIWPDGKIDFGGDPEDEPDDRFAQLEDPVGGFKPGATVRWSYGFDMYQGRVTKIHPLS
jgi:hypothetical protein